MNLLLDSGGCDEKRRGSLMHQSRLPRKLTDELLDYLFADISTALAAELRAYCASSITVSPRFKSFATENRDKIRKKIREAGDRDRLRDLRLELDTAYHLLADHHLTVAYEMHAATKLRTPDFTVAYTIKYTFHVEVKHLRGVGNDVRLADAVCAKLGQLQPAAINLVLVGVDSESDTALDTALALAALRNRAERKDDDYFQRRDFRDSHDFLRHFQRLSGVVCRTGWMQPDGGSSQLWVNLLARHPLPPELRRILAR
jgi:hypothetical protein